MKGIISALLIISSIFGTLICCNTPNNEVTNETSITETQSIGNELLDSLIKEDPKNPDLFYQRALNNYQNGINPAALADIYTAITLDSANADYYYLAGDLFIEMNQGNKAIALMSKGISMMPDNEELYLRAVEYNWYMGNHEAAINFANDLLVKNKYKAEAYFLKGMIFKELNQTDKAISNFQTCVEQDPTFYNAYMQLGLLFSQQGNPICISYYENALRLQPQSREAIYGIAYFHQTQQNYKTAISSYKQIVSNNPKDHEAFFNIGYCYMEADSLLKAYNNFNIATQLNPQFANAFYMKGYVSELAKNYEDAQLNYKQANALLPENEEIKNALSRVNQLL